MPAKNSKQTQETLKGVQKEVCADILRTGDVLKSAVVSSLIEELSGKIERSDLVSVKQNVENDITRQLSSLIERVVKTTTA